MNLSLKSLGLSAFLASVFVSFAISGAQADAAAGEKTFKRCVVCHSIGPEAKNKSGPVLNGVVGRTAGIAVGFKYGSGILEARGDIGEDGDGDGYLDVPDGYTGLVWTEENLIKYLENPKKFLVGYTSNSKAKARMALRVKKESDRANVVEYLKTVGLDGNPVTQ